MVDVQEPNATLLTGQLEKQRAAGSASRLARTPTQACVSSFGLTRGRGLELTSSLGSLASLAYAPPFICPCSAAGTPSKHVQIQKNIASATVYTVSSHCF
jgi:hypothetical protein